jgi:hypothetical protein
MTATMSVLAGERAVVITNFRRMGSQEGGDTGAAAASRREGRAKAVEQRTTTALAWLRSFVCLVQSMKVFKLFTRIPFWCNLHIIV